MWISWDSTTSTDVLVYNIDELSWLRQACTLKIADDEVVRQLFKLSDITRHGWSRPEPSPDDQRPTHRCTGCKDRRSHQRFWQPMDDPAKGSCRPRQHQNQIGSLREFAVQ